LKLRIETPVNRTVIPAILIALACLSLGFVGTNKGPMLLPTANGLVIGAIHFEEIYFLAGQNLERRSPRVGEEFIVKATIRNIGPAVIWYLPSLCDSSLSAVFDASYVRVESGRPRCLAASMPTPLNPNEETTVWGPESGTAYAAIRAGSTTATAIFTYNTDANMDPSTKAEARSTVPLTIESVPGELLIPGFPIESLVFGFAVALSIFMLRKRVKTSQDACPTSVQHKSSIGSDPKVPLVGAILLLD